jgi:hypothetical protein
LLELIRLPGLVGVYAMTFLILWDEPPSEAEALDESYTIRGYACRPCWLEKVSARWTR